MGREQHKTTVADTPGVHRGLIALEEPVPAEVFADDE
jgi:hypothetical protein